MPRQSMRTRYGRVFSGERLAVYTVYALIYPAASEAKDGFPIKTGLHRPYISLS